MHCWVTGEWESWLFLPDKHDELVMTVTHESWHVVRRVLDLVGSALENEIVAYHIGYLSQAVYNLYSQKKGKRHVYGR